MSCGVFTTEFVAQRQHRATACDLNSDRIMRIKSAQIQIRHSILCGQAFTQLGSTLENSGRLVGGEARHGYLLGDAA